MKRLNCDWFDEDYQLLLRIKEHLQVTSIIAALRFIVRDYAKRNLP